MFEKILIAIKTKYKDFGLSENILKAYAKKLEKAVKEEKDIDDAVEDLETELQIVQSQNDTIRNLKSELDKLKKEGGKKETKEGADPQPLKTEETPDYVKELQKTLDAVTKTLTSIQSEKTNESNNVKLLSKLKEKGVSENFYKHHIAGKVFAEADGKTIDEQIDEFVIGLKNSEDTFMQSIKNQQLSQASNPVFGQSTPNSTPPEVQDYIKRKHTQTNEKV